MAAHDWATWLGWFCRFQFRVNTHHIHHPSCLPSAAAFKLNFLSLSKFALSNSIPHSFLSSSGSFPLIFLSSNNISPSPWIPPPHHSSWGKMGFHDVL
ncbi:hypothetical protein Csa_002425 [Cucumis sativus]|uniref:Uncharacterized protein n=1 Tax=Cucumis sativus TaxID=3659 RepID=A0A0A0LKD6_CUCSA|nr:hypothetical protein Csa_002425 [Cucumis sativus]